MGSTSKGGGKGRGGNLGMPGPIGGRGPLLSRLVWVVVAATLTGAGAKATGVVGGEAASTLQEKTDVVSAYSQSIADQIETAIKSGKMPKIKLPNPDSIKAGSGGGKGGAFGGGTTNVPSAPPRGGVTPVEAKSSLEKVSVGRTQQVQYSRDEWRHWMPLRQCWNVDEQVKARDAVPGTLVMKDAKGQTTKDVGRACSIVSGRWNDPYTGAVITNPRNLDVDHMVPLKNAAQSGGQAWSADKKQAYANDLKDPRHLIAVSAAANRSKGAKSPDQWMPNNKAFAQQYVAAWTGVKTRWGLSMTMAEKAKIASVLAGK